MNDGVAEPWGRFWAGSMAYDNTPNAGTLYRVDNDGTVIPPSAAAWASATPTAPSTTTPAFLRRAVAFFTAHGSDHSSPGSLAFLHTHNHHH
ncbi:SMP-30/gluconolactonase/LRE family protein [Streptomyces sp. BBFR25]|uniref:SMP-30/gluconolactonase/LRE family protein n=1 Tax=Streptomyces sp. BBFR25 TaxID=3372855 RepID=UPI0037DDB514